MNITVLALFAHDFKQLFEQLQSLQLQIRQRLIDYSDGKHLKGHELVGWLGEIHAKILLGGILVHDKHEHDVETSCGWRVRNG
jgi:hypothetical protein